MIPYAYLIKRCRRYRHIEGDRFIILEWRLRRRWKRELRRRGLKVK